MIEDAMLFIAGVACGAAGLWALLHWFNQFK